MHWANGPDSESELDRGSRTYPLETPKYTTILACPTVPCPEVSKNSSKTTMALAAAQLVSPASLGSWSWNGDDLNTVHFQGRHPSTFVDGGRRQKGRRGLRPGPLPASPCVPPTRKAAKHRLKWAYEVELRKEKTTTVAGSEEQATREERMFSPKITKDVFPNHYNNKPLNVIP